MSSVSNYGFKPTVLFSSEDRVFFELPSGKIGKDGNKTIQKGQKGNTCTFYAMKRLLTPEQVHSEHGQICSLHRKMITAVGTEFSSLETFHKARVKANEAFFKAKGLDCKKAAHEFWIDTLKQGMAEMPDEFLTSAMLENSMAQIKPILTKIKPWYRFEQIGNAVTQLMTRGHGLQEVPCKDLATMKELIKTLRTKGPLMISGRFGKRFYADLEPVQFIEKVGTHALYGWKKGTATSEAIGLGHAIVLIGAEIIKDKQYVYWLNPEDPSNPEDPNSPRVYVSSFENIKTRMTTVAGLSMDLMTPQSKAIIAGAILQSSLCPKLITQEVYCIKTPKKR